MPFGVAQAQEQVQPGNVPNSWSAHGFINGIESKNVAAIFGLLSISRVRRADQLRPEDIFDQKPATVYASAPSTSRT